MRNMICPHCAGYQNYTIVHTNSAISRYLPSVLPNLSKLLTSVPTVVKMGLRSYHDTRFSRGSIYQMCVIKNSNDLLKTLFSRSQCVCNRIKTFDFSILYTTIPRTQLKSRIQEYYSYTSLFSILLWERTLFKIWCSRRMENNGTSILLFLEISLILSKSTQNLILNINRTRSFKCLFLQACDADFLHWLLKNKR